MNWREIRFYDVADDNEANEDARERGEEAPSKSQPGVVYRLRDGTPIGTWRVAAEDIRKPREQWTWAVYDLRRGSASMKTILPLKVAGGYKSKEAAILAAQVLAWSPTMRLALACLRVVRAGVAAVREEGSL